MKATFLAAGILAAFLFKVQAQTNYVVVTNYVTVVVTNVVTITNLVSMMPSTNSVTTNSSVALTPAPEITNAAAVTPVPPPTPKYPWESSVSAGLTLTRGNSHTILYSSTFQTAKKTPENEYTLGANGAYGSQNSKDNVNNYGGFTQWNHLFTERFYGYFRVDALRDVVADLDYRVNAGPGIGYYVIKNTNTSLAFETGGGIQYEHLGGEYNSYGTVRFADRFEHKFADRARLWQKAEILPQVDKFQNYVVNFEIGIEASITKTFGLKTYLDDTYQSEPAEGRYRNDAKIVSALYYKF
jgi:putative salt-induced outer membrane protein